jgi:translocation and assembly module TamB
MKTNKLIFVFLLVMLSPYWSLKLALKSEIVTKYILSHVQRVLPKDQAFVLSGDSVEISFVFLETTIKNLEVKKNGKMFFEKGDLSLKFSIQDLLKRKFRVGRLEIVGGSASLDLSLSSEPPSDKLKIESLLEDLPIRELKLSGVLIRSENNDFSVTANDLNFEKKGKNDVAIFSSLTNLNSKNIRLDSVKFSGSIKKNVIRAKAEILKGVSTIELTNVRYDLINNFGKGSLVLSALGRDICSFFPEENCIAPHLEIFGNGHLNFENMKVNSGSIDIAVESPNEKYMDIKRLSASLSLSENTLTLNNLLIKNYKAGYLDLVNKLTYDLEKKSLKDIVILKLNNFSLNTEETFYKAQGVPTLSIETTGVLEIIQKDDLEIRPKNLAVHSFGLGEESTTLSLRDFNLDGLFVMGNMGEKDLSVKFFSKNSSLNVKGKFDSGRVFISAEESKIDLDEFKHFSGVEVSGLSEGNLSFVSTPDKMILKYDLMAKDLFVSDYFLGDSNGVLTIDFAKNKLKIENLNSDIKGSSLNLNGSFDLKSSGNYEIRGTSKNLNSFAVRSILKNNLGSITKHGSLIDFRGHSSFLINGDYTKLFNVGVKIRGNFFKYGKEVFDYFEIDTNIDQGKVSLEPFVLRRGNNSIFTSGNFVFSNQELNLRVSGEDIQLESFNFIKEYFPSAKGNVTINANHQGGIDNGNGALDIKVSDLENDFVEYKSNSFKVLRNGSLFDIKSDLFDNQIKLDSFFDISSLQKSRVDFRVDLPRLDKLLSLYQSEMMWAKGIESQVSLIASSDFFLNKPNSLNLTLDISDLYLKRKKSNLYIQYPYNKVVIESGVVKNSTIKLFGGDHYLNFFIEGGKFNHSKLFIDSYLDVGLFELLVPSKFGINMSGDFFIFANINFIEKVFLNYNIDFKQTSISSVLYNRSVSGVNISLSGDSSSLFLESATADYGGGSVNSSGVAYFKDKGVGLDFDFDLFNIKLSFLQKSNASFDFRGGINGDNIPYSITGALKLKEVNLLESINGWLDLSSMSSSSQKNKLMFKNNFVIESRKPIRIKNNLMDIQVDSKLNLRGDNLSPRIDGKLNIIPGLSKVFLKGNMFSVTDGAVRLRKSNGKPDPYFDINAETVIDSYNLKSGIVGDLKNLNINFISDPPLAQEDIFSLLAIGVTLKKTRNLGASAINNVTSLGLGSFLLDQTGINNSLDETLGVKVSIAPEIINDETSLLEGRVNQSVGDVQSRVRSATKIRLTKRISNSLDMSYSSTLGGSLDQRQEMNLNLKVDKNIMIQGVYQTQSSDNSENTDTTNSMGLDLIWKKTFK